jgi:putative two-component system response regulator
MNDSSTNNGVGRASVLVIDDDDQVRRAVTRILERYGHTCTTAADTRQAREELEISEPDIVLCDVRMPGESGLHFLARIREQRPNLPVVMLSGIGELNIATDALGLGAYGWLTKPFDSNQVLIAVSNALIRARLEEQSRAYEQRLEQAVLDRTRELGDTVVKLERSERELRRVTEDTIQALTRAIERRDIETGDHIARVSRYATMLARCAGMPEPLCERIRAASPMHDVGKVGVPDGILLKPGRVTPAEFDVIKQHVVLGHAILSRSTQPLLQLAAEIAYTHHERWDGRGYPSGLRADDIPFEGRITAIADTFDALVTRRVYKSAVPLERAYHVIREERGSHFDPELVDLFLEHRDEAAAIFADLPDN